MDDHPQAARAGVTKSAEAFRTISEAAAELAVPQHVLRFWETRFPQVKPLKRGGGRRYYRPEDMTLLRRIHGLLYDEGYTIRGVQKLLKETGVKALLARAPGAAGAASGRDEGAAGPSDSPADPDSGNGASNGHADPAPGPAVAPAAPPASQGVPREALRAMLGELEGIRRLLKR